MQRLPWVRLLLGIGIFGLLFLVSGLQEIPRALQSASTTPIIGTLLLNLPILAIASFRSSLVLRSLGHVIRLDLLLASSVVGYVVGALTPAASGELLRVQMLNQSGSVPHRDSVALIALERILSFYLLCLTTTVAAAFAVLSSPLAILVASLALAMAAAPAVAGGALRRIPTVSEHSNHALAGPARFLRGVVADVGDLLDDRVVLVSVSLTSVAIFGLVALQFWLLSEAVGASIGLDIAWLGFGTAQIASIASMLPFGLGVLDSSLTGMLAAFGVATQSGFATAMLVRAAISGPLLVSALVAYLYLTASREAAAIPATPSRSEK